MSPEMMASIKKSIQTAEEVVKEAEDRPVFSPTHEQPKTSLRAVARVNEKGEICLKLYVGGELKYEAKAEGGTVNIETFLDP